MPVEWTDPPPPRGRAWEGIAQELRSRPGQWALIAKDASPETATRIKNGILIPFRPAGSFEARTARRKSSSSPRCDVYARYVGDET